MASSSWGYDGTYPVEVDEDSDNWTDTDTSSDDLMEPVDSADVSHMNEADAVDAIYMAYRNAKRTWRRC